MPSVANEQRNKKLAQELYNKRGMGDGPKMHLSRAKFEIAAYDVSEFNYFRQN